jgi:predicted amidohydrolase
MSSVRVACCQIAPEVGRPEHNAALCREAIRAAVDGGARIIVLPELANSGYIFESIDETRAAAETPDGELLAGWAEEAARGDALVIGGFAELGPDGTLFNSSALVDASGVRTVYRKLHLWDQEPWWFEPGSDPAPVVATSHGALGLAVCYDIEFPELTRGLALEGAELLVIPTNWPYEEPPDGRPVLHSLAAMTAYYNKAFVAVCDRCGTEHGVEFEGGSVIAGPRGALLAGPVPGRGTGTIYADLDLSAAVDKHTSERNDAFADRRVDQYSPALASGGGVAPRVVSMRPMPTSTEVGRG